MHSIIKEKALWVQKQNIGAKVNVGYLRGCITTLSISVHHLHYSFYNFAFILLQYNFYFPYGAGVIIWGYGLGWLHPFWIFFYILNYSIKRFSIRGKLQSRIAKVPPESVSIFKFDYVLFFRRDDMYFHFIGLVYEGYIYIFNFVDTISYGGREREVNLPTNRRTTITRRCHYDADVIAYRYMKLRDQTRKGTNSTWQLLHVPRYWLI